MEFTTVVNQVKLMAQYKGIRIHQYLEDWLVRAASHQICLQHSQTLVALCQELGWVVNMEQLELESKQILDFVEYQYDFRESKAKFTLELWQTLNLKIQKLQPYCQAASFFS